jgi:CheY-like chemotaxis protein
MADPTQVEQVLMNLCLNARDAMPQGGRLIIETHNLEIGDEYCLTHVYANPGSYVLLSVSDTGVGMDEATIARIFEPFFTTKEIGRGTGLGLATVYGIVKQHGGFIHVYSEPGKGSSFRVYFKAEKGVHEPGEAAHETQLLKGTETILLVDDHEGLRASADEMLQALGYRTLLARNGSEALEVFKANGDRVDLVLMDVVMPELNGPEAYAKMAELRPGIKVIFTTGYTSEAALLISRLAKGTAILQKPYGLASLSHNIRRALDREPH